MNKFPLMCFVAFCFQTTVVWSADEKVTQTLMPELGMGQVVKTFFALLFVLACIFVIGWLMQRLQKFNPAHSSAIQVLSVTPLSTKERLVLIQAGHKQLLLGVSAGRMTTICEFDEPIVVAKPASGNTFADKLSQYLKREPSQ